MYITLIYYSTNNILGEVIKYISTGKYGLFIVRGHFNISKYYRNVSWSTNLLAHQHKQTEYI